MAKKDRVSKGSSGARKKMGLPAKSGKRHLVNPNHPFQRPVEQQVKMQKGVR